MKTDTNQKLHRRNNIWLIALILLILTIATGALVTSLFKGIVSGEKNVIALFPNKTTKSLANDVSYVPAKLDPEMKASDGETNWETYTDVDLFKTTYTGTDGQVTVKSENGEKIIAPGTTNSYRFSLKNTGNVSLDYTLSLDGVFKLANQNMPFEVRLSKGNEWLAGGEEQWVSINDLNKVVEKATLPVGKYVTYVMEWQWPFENDEKDMLLLQDLNDTILGDTATTADTDFKLSINTVSEVTPGAVAEDKNGKPVYEEVISHRTITYVGGPLLAAIGALCVLVFLLLGRRRIYVTGFAYGMEGRTITWKKKNDTVRTDGRFAFAKVSFGSQTFLFEQDQGQEWNVRLKRKSDVRGIQIENADGESIIFVGKNVQAIEIYLQKVETGFELQTNRWAAIDKAHVVYTPDGEKEPDREKCNHTPGGLRVDAENKFGF